MPEALKPYVVSSDLKGLMRHWGSEKGFQLPKDNFFDGITRDLHSVLSGYFEQVDIVPEEELRTGINSFAEQREYKGFVKHENPIQIVSMDRAYVDKNTKNIFRFLDMTRGVDENLQPVGLSPRPGAKQVSDQLDEFRSERNFPVILLDDVIFNGDGIHWTMEEMAKRNRSVVKIIAGIGIRSKGLQRLEDLVEVQCVREYDDVVDEVCQRDFVAGAPMSGRTVFHKDKTVSSAPYFRPFGDPEDWASIPSDKVSEFSEFCLGQSIEIFNRIEHESRRNVPTSAIDRLPTGISSNGSFADALKNVQRERF